MTSSTIRLLFFAVAREIVGEREVDLPIDAGGIDVRALAAVVADRYPSLAGHMRSLRWAINGEYAQDDDRVAPGDEVAVLPPVAGG